MLAWCWSVWFCFACSQGIHCGRQVQNRKIEHPAEQTTRSCTCPPQCMRRPLCNFLSLMSSRAMLCYVFKYHCNSCVWASRQYNSVRRFVCWTLHIRRTSGWIDDVILCLVVSKFEQNEHQRFAILNSWKKSGSRVVKTFVMLFCRKLLNQIHHN